MDNLTHSLVACAIAETAYQVAKKKREVPNRERWALYCASLAANNLPDLDIVYTSITHGKLGYLLHHRGHTHTLVFAWFIAPLIYFACKKLFRLGTRSHALIGVCVLGPMFHIFMDYWNLYGVHPYWPLNNQWYFGDAVFIIEPLLWLILLPGLYRCAQSLIANIVLIAMMIGTGSIIVFSGYVKTTGMLTAGLVLVASFLFQRWVREGLSQIIFTLTSTALFLSILFLGSHRIKSNILSHWSESVKSNSLGRSLVSIQVLDIALTPHPSQPYCWEVLILAKNKTQMGVFRGRSSLLSTRDLDSLCHEYFIGEATASYHGSTGSPALNIGPLTKIKYVWWGEIDDFKKHYAENCDFRAFLKFARFPFWKPGTVDSLIMGDHRFDRGPGLGFTEFATAAIVDKCPQAVPPWVSPWARHSPELISR